MEKLICPIEKNLNCTLLSNIFAYAEKENSEKMIRNIKDVTEVQRKVILFIIISSSNIIIINYIDKFEHEQ